MAGQLPHTTQTSSNNVTIIDTKMAAEETGHVTVRIIDRVIKAGDEEGHETVELGHVIGVIIAAQRMETRLTGEMTPSTY